MKFLKKHIYIIAGLFLLAACKPEVKTAQLTHGSANFSRFIAVGNSLTAGYADGGLYLDGQLNSYPSIMAGQMQSVGGGSFNQPLFTSAQANGSGYLQLTGFNADGTPITTPVTTDLAIRGILPVPGFGNVTLYTKYTGDIENYGVPGIKLLNITYAPYGNLNGYFERLLPNDAPTNTTDYLDFVTAKPFTFFSDWLGNNDALLYATSGGAGDVLTDETTFAQLYSLSISKLTATGAKGVVATIPDVTSIPYFNTVTVNAIVAGVQKLNPAVQGIYINALVSGTTYAPRLATAKDLIVLTFPTSMIGQLVSTPYGELPYGLTPYSPIDNQYVLDANEIALTQEHVLSFNSTITSIAASKGLAVFDAYTFLNNIKQNGLVIDGLNLNSNYISGGLFSLDGVHLTPRGYAIVANEFIKAINSKYGSNIPLANVANYRGVKFP
ncbi:GDSL-like lipase/acylhydrolase family protein [Mucilaginibacter frigoritolerans]|uniref:GDSL-like lipase/acylhydrolase family protein n=1 Tax=Mucilaginibacter frigoritolerans TaxID=652788 RepID=A0A562TRR8_9SPHI|nr:SGNH/GDSL hydrolase family protein [Mucilaginibacter frigoritolerans]TWI96225.1 GDSL-like lipase/acylhydrolase family protein [Mucilaginibacter frigoritolerans]